MQFTFVRHGSTQWNSQRRFQGQSDIPLDERGRAQAQALAALLRGEDFDHAVSSDLSRAYDTARAIRGDLPLERDERWREFAFGAWEGLTWEQILERFPEAADQQWSVAKRYAPPGGETFESVQARVSHALDDLAASGHANVLIVTHAGPLHAMLHTFFGNRESEYQEVLAVRFSPASVTRVEVAGGRAQLVALNDVAHLTME
ncbi:MAG TPA: histidine phosphatase family protein [Candidatus Baltobacteraceae bacterium]|nr:histidine phosphatase family protein [Candidatus Baltobacteraceae bacterium]